MIRRIIWFSLQLRFLVVVIAVVLVAFGVAQLRNTPVDVLPEFSPPYVEIQTEALGLSAEEVEQLITLGLEQDLLNGVPWLRTIYSESLPGLSSIVLVFDPGTDLLRARQMVSERLAQAFALPHVSKPPTMLQPLSSTSRVIIIGLSSKDLSLIQMSVLAHWTIKPRLMGVPGVANVATWGQRDRQLQVQVDPKRLQDNNISLFQVLETTGNALWVSSLSFLEASTPGTGGFIDTSNQRLGIRHMLPIVSPEGLAQVPIGDTGVRLGDVANVIEDHQPLIGDALTNDGSSLLLVVQKFPGANTRDVTRGVEDALATLRPGLTGLEMNSQIFRPADFIEMAIDNLALAVLLGFIFIALVLVAFFFKLRTVMISLVAIPISFVAAGLVLSLSGATMNMMVLTGFLIAIGVVVGDAIIDVENIVSRMRQARLEGSTKPAASIILEASLEMRGVIFYSMLILLLVVLPIFFIGGVPGAFFQPLAVSYGLALLASMLVAMTITPALCLLLLVNEPIERYVSPIVVRLQHVYESWLARIVQRGGLTIIIVGIFTVTGLVILPFLDLSLMPTFKERNLVIHMNGAPGISQTEMSRMSGRISQELQSIPGVLNVGTHIGRAVMSDEVVNVSSAELWVSMKPEADYDKTAAAIQDVVDGYPGLYHEVQTYLKEKSNEAGVTEPKNSLVIRVYGDTDGVLRMAAEDVKKAITGITGIVTAQLKLPVQQPILEIEVDLAAAQQYGIKPGDVRRAAATMFSGLQVGSLFEEQKVFDVVVWSTPETRQSLSSIRNLLIDTPNGEHVRLGDVAQVHVASTSSVIRHEAVKRYIDVVADVQGRDLGAVTNDIKARLQNVQFPLEYHAEVLGGFAEQQGTFTRLIAFAIAAVLGIFLLTSGSL